MGRRAKPNPPSVIYRVRNTRTGMFANLRGGWDSTGQTWKAHHAVLAFLERKGDRFPPGTAEVVTYEVKVLAVHPVEAFRQTILDKKAKRELNLKKAKLVQLEFQAERLVEDAHRRAQTVHEEIERLGQEIRAMERGAA